MLILPPGHAQSIRGARRSSLRERRLLGMMVGLVALLAVAIVVALGTAARTSGSGCIYVTIPAPTGAQVLDECGATARNTCSTVRMPGAFTAEAAQTVSAACRKARLAVGG